MALDSRLNWEENTNKLRAKANTIKMVVAKKWGKDQKTLKTVQCNI